jgi:hypothetical protein
MFETKMSRVRYLEDVRFHNLVKTMAAMMEEFHFTPSDMREAADVAIDINTEDLRRKLREYGGR